MVWIILFAIVVAIIGGLLQANANANKKNERSASLKSKLSEIENFTVTKQIEGIKALYVFAIDDINHKIAYIEENKQFVFLYSDIIGVELIEDGDVISKKSTTRTVSGAIIGGVLAGGVGAIVGGLSGNSTNKSKVSSLYVKILLRNLDNPSLLISCFDSKTMTVEGKKSIETEGKIESYIYQEGKRTANEIKDLISIIIDKTDNNTDDKNNQSKFSMTDELLKLNDLKEKGILTEDEFLTQKSKILNR